MKKTTNAHISTEKIGRPALAGLIIAASIAFIYPAAAQVVFYTDEAAWLAAVNNVETLTTDAAGVATASEVTNPPAQNENVGAILSFDGANTGLSRSFTVETLQSGAEFTFSDGEPSPSNPGYENALSVGDIDNFEDDDWGVTLTGGPAATAFAFSLRDNGDFDNPTDVLTVFDANGAVLGSTSAIPTSTDGSAFFGFTSSVPVARVEYNDDATGDDIAIADFRFANLTPSPTPGLLNISTRMQVLTGDQVLIGGFIITGTDPKMVILRAIGPSLSDFGVAGALADPVLELRAVDGSVITSNDNWTSDRAAIEATGLQPSRDLESAIVATLDPGAYTAIVNGKNGITGVGLVEAYDLDQAAASELANISTRGFVDTGNNVMIGGFILGSDTNVLVRAIGPTLSDFGVTGALQDPNLELRDGQGTLVSSNDNWMDSAQKTEIEGTGLAPQKDPESAVLETLPTGAYTAIVSGQGGTAGVGLVEVYRLP